MKRSFMKLPLAIFILFLATALSRTASAANQVLLRYLDLGDSGTAKVLAADNSGNIFTVSTTSDQSGLSWVRVIKTDSQGTPLARFDFPARSLSFLSGGPAAAATDAQGNLVIVGSVGATYSNGALVTADFPLVKPLFPTVIAGGAFVMKLDSQLQGILFSTFISAGSSANALALDSAGDIYVAGSDAGDLPVTAGAFQTKPSTGLAAFLSEISPNGDHFLYSTYFGGDSAICASGVDTCQTTHVFAQTSAYALAIGPSGAVAIAGETTATDLPVTAGVVGSFCRCSNLAASGFIAVFSPGAPQTLAWSTYVNQAQGPVSYQPNLTINALAFDPAGNVVAGGVAGQMLGTTPGVLQPRLTTSGWAGGFAAKVNASGTAFIWSTYFGGFLAGSSGGVSSLAVDSKGAVVITGFADPSSLPPFSGTPPLGTSYVARISSDATALQELYVGPANSAGAGLVLTPAGSFVSLGKSGALWIETTASGPSLLATANAASGPVSGLVAPAELISIYGIGIGPPNALQGQISAGRYTSSLGGYQVLFDGVAAPLLYAGPTQINAVVPQAVAYGDYTQMQIVTPSGTIAGPTLAVRQSEPYIFQNSLTGLAAALNQDGSVNSPQNPAKAGEIVTIFAPFAKSGVAAPPAGAAVAACLVSVFSPPPQSASVNALTTPTTIQIFFMLKEPPHSNLS